MVGYGPIAKGVAMFSDRRHEAILARLTQAGEVAVGPLATELGCAVETIRRDLAELEQRGQIKRVHGGAVQVPPAEQPPIATRQVRDRKVKDAIAAAAAALVPAGAHIWLGAGSTVLALAVRLFDLPARTTFATNMIDVARLLARSRHQVFLAGGEINADSMAQNGAETLDFIEARYFDLAIVGAAALHADLGLMGPTAHHRALHNLLNRRTEQQMVLAASTKFGGSDRYQLAEWRYIATVVTDRTPPQSFRASLKRSSTRIVLSDGRGRPQGGNVG